MNKSNFEKLDVWVKAKDLAVDIYSITNNKIFARDFGLKDQIRRSSVSVSSNIAEGDERASNKEAVRFFYIAKGSIAEVRTQLRIAQEVGYLKEEDFKDIEAKAYGIAQMLGALIRVRGEKGEFS